MNLASTPAPYIKIIINIACSKSVKIGFSIPINGVIWSSINVCKYNPPATDETVLSVKHIKTRINLNL